MAKANGYILYEGPSQIDGKPIVVIATGFAKGSSNEKTGAGLIQTWIIRSDVKPTDAVNTGDDASICGDCPHRGEIVDGRNVNRSCYVTIFQAPLNVFKTYQKGGYEAAGNLALLGAGRGVRLGSYGDPAAIPMHVWEAFCSLATFRTGYTHQWRSAPLELAQYCMASADTASDKAAANMLGYRVFRVRHESEPLEAREIVCPASKEAGYKTTCDACKACGGLGAKAKADIAIVAHGAAGKVNAFNSRQKVSA